MTSTMRIRARGKVEAVKGSESDPFSSDLRFEGPSLAPAPARVVAWKSHFGHRGCPFMFQTEVRDAAIDAT